jgi:hypothetical protein
MMVFRYSEYCHRIETIRCFRDIRRIHAPPRLHVSRRSSLSRGSVVSRTSAFLKETHMATVRNAGRKLRKTLPYHVAALFSVAVAITFAAAFTASAFLIG